MIKFKVKELKYKTIKELLKDYFLVSNRLLAKLKREKKIYLNGKPEYVTKELKLNDIVEIDFFFNERSENIAPTKMNLNILYEDEYLLIIDKPANMPVHPSLNHFNDSLSNGIANYYNEKNINSKIMPVNRLDKDTSGIVIFAKCEYVQECLIKQMKENIFKKEYLAILTDFLKTESGTINAPIMRKEASIIERVVSEKGEPAITHYELIKNFIYNGTKLSHVKFILETGRTHQIRVHSKYLGNPILGDTLYGTSSPLIARQALHAYKITFIHPILKKEMIIESNLPEDIKTLLKEQKRHD